MHEYDKKFFKFLGCVIAVGVLLTVIYTTFQQKCYLDYKFFFKDKVVLHDAFYGDKSCTVYGHSENNCPIVYDLDCGGWIEHKTDENLTKVE